MYIDKFNKWLMLASNIGVLAGIIFLGIEINQNTTVARSATRQAIAEMIASRPMVTFENKEAAELSLKIFSGEPMTELERFQVMTRWYSTMRDWESIHYQYQTGMLTGDEWRGFRLNLKELFDTPSLQEFWANEHQFFSQRFQDEASAILKEKEEEGPGFNYDYFLDNAVDDN